MGATMAPATASVMGSLPLAKAGVGSAMNDTTRQVGGALGVAVLGSVLSSSYREAITPALAGLPGQAAAAAHDSLGAALGVAGRLGAAGGTLAQAARGAFVDAMGDVALVAAAAALLGALVTLVLLPARAPARAPEPLHDVDLAAAAATLVALAEALESSSDGVPARLRRAAGALVPAQGRSEEERARAAAREVLRPLAARTLRRVAQAPGTPAGRDRAVAGRRLQTVTRFYVGILGGIAGMLSGAWLMLAPFALGYQPENAAWADATKVDVFTGIGILVLGLVSVAAFAAGLAATLRAEGALPPRARRAVPPPEPVEATGEVAELRSVLARLAAALENHEQTEPSGERHGEPAATPARERRAS
jgi:hypothetical protein